MPDRVEDTLGGKRRGPHRVKVCEVWYLPSDLDPPGYPDVLLRLGWLEVGGKIGVPYTTKRIGTRRRLESREPPARVKQYK
jgi:hypothetical protein